MSGRGDWTCGFVLALPPLRAASKAEVSICAGLAALQTPDAADPGWIGGISKRVQEV
jgi:hypothetical protein